MALICYGANRRHGPWHARKKHRLTIAFALQEIVKNSITVVIHLASRQVILPNFSRGKNEPPGRPSVFCLGTGNSPGLPRGSSAAEAGPRPAGWGALGRCPLARFGGNQPRRWLVHSAGLVTQTQTQSPCTFVLCYFPWRLEMEISLVNMTTATPPPCLLSQSPSAAADPQAVQGHGVLC
jgi:hypothetical protein